MMFCGIMMAQTKAGVSPDFIYGGFTLDRNRVIQVAQMNTDVYMNKYRIKRKDKGSFLNTFSCVMQSIEAGYCNKINYDHRLELVWVTQPDDTEMLSHVVHFLNEICKGLVERKEYK